MWEYIAGLFDGDGHASICRHISPKGVNSIAFIASITTSRPKKLQSMIEFLKREGFLSRKKSIWTFMSGKTFKLQIQGKECILFLKKIHPYLLQKRESINIIFEAYNLKEKYKKDNNIKITHHIADFNTFRFALSKLASKGNRNIKRWEN